MNMGAYWHVEPRIKTCLAAEGRPVQADNGAGGYIKYAGRPPSAATATGFGEVHAQEQAALIRTALDVGAVGSA